MARAPGAKASQKRRISESRQKGRRIIGRGLGGWRKRQRRRAVVLAIFHSRRKSRRQKRAAEKGRRIGRQAKNESSAKGRFGLSSKM
jgi:hypothetical protein